MPTGDEIRLHIKSVNKIIFILYEYHVLKK